MRGRCPRCGVGWLFARYLVPAEGCTACGLSYAGENAGDGAAAFLILIIGALGTGYGLWLMFTFDPPLWVLIALTFPPLILLVLLLLPMAKGLLIALQYVNRAGDTGHSDFGNEG